MRAVTRSAIHYEVLSLINGGGILEFNPGTKACESFRSMFGDNAEQSPIGGYAGCSHFGFVNPANVNAQNPGWHVTTEVPDLKQGQTIARHNFVNNMKF